MGNVVNRVFDSSGPEGKVRGTPQQIIDKYNQLARDAQLSNDRVATENFQQHAEHYLRMLGEAQKEMDARREQQERENRERQAERDRERAERAEARDASNGGADAFEPMGYDQPQPDVAAMPSPRSEVVNEAPVEAKAEGEKPARKPRKAAPRKRTPKPAEAVQDPLPMVDTDQAEAGE
jgi:hypothetical protein